MIHIPNALQEALCARKESGMLINTKDFDFVSVKEEDIIHFPEGIYAFEDCKHFVVLDTRADAGVMQLQCTDAQNPRFMILDPFMFLEDYAPSLPADAMKTLKADSVEELSFFVIAVIPENIRDATVNLKSPVVINFGQHVGMQVILENREYSVRFRLFGDERKE